MEMGEVLRLTDHLVSNWPARTPDRNARPRSSFMRTQSSSLSVEVEREAGFCSL